MGLLSLKRHTHRITACILLMLWACFPLHAAGTEKLSVGIGWPYLGVKYDLGDTLAAEARWAAGDGIQVYAGRFYWSFYRLQRTGIFTGLEAGGITFDTLDITGTGYEAAAFIGCEYLITDRLSFIMDIAPVFISLNSDDVGVDGIEWVTNLSVYYRFGKKEFPVKNTFSRKKSFSRKKTLKKEGPQKKKPRGRSPW